MKSEKGVHFISLCLFAGGRGICNILRHLLSLSRRAGVINYEWRPWNTVWYPATLHTDDTEPMVTLSPSNLTSHHLSSLHGDKDARRLVPEDEVRNYHVCSEAEGSFYFETASMCPCVSGYRSGYQHATCRFILFSLLVISSSKVCLIFILSWDEAVVLHIHPAETWSWRTHWIQSSAHKPHRQTGLVPEICAVCFSGCLYRNINKVNEVWNIASQLKSCSTLKDLKSNYYPDFSRMMERLFKTGPSYLCGELLFRIQLLFQPRLTPACSFTIG